MDLNVAPTFDDAIKTEPHVCHSCGQCDVFAEGYSMRLVRTHIIGKKQIVGIKVFYCIHCGVVNMFVGPEGIVLTKPKTETQFKS